MKIQHFVWLDKIIESNSNSTTIQISGLEDYQPLDFNIFLAIAVLKQAKLITQQIAFDFDNQLNNYLYTNIIKLPPIDYKGDLADAYLQLDEESKKMSTDPDYRLTANTWFNAIHLGETIPENMFLINNQLELQLQISKARGLLIEKIATKIGQKINTIGVKYKTTPITLIIEPFKYDEAEFEKLNAIANQIVKSFSFQKQSSDEGTIKIIY